MSITDNKITPYLKTYWYVCQSRVKTTVITHRTDGLGRAFAFSQGRLKFPRQRFDDVRWLDYWNFAKIRLNRLYCFLKSWAHFISFWEKYTIHSSISQGRIGDRECSYQRSRVSLLWDDRPCSAKGTVSEREILEEILGQRIRQRAGKVRDPKVKYPRSPDVPITQNMLRFECTGFRLKIYLRQPDRRKFIFCGFYLWTIIRTRK